jgi:hypothetical protein
MAAARFRDRDRVQHVVARDDAYLYMIWISVGAMFLGCLILGIDMYRTSFNKQTVPTVQPVSRGSDGNLPGINPAPTGAPGTPPS